MDSATLVAGSTSVDVPWSLLLSWSGLARIFRGDNPGEGQMVLTNWQCEAGVDKGAAVVAFVRFGLRLRDREDGTRMDDSDAVGAVSVAHLMQATTQWFMAANEGLRGASRAGQAPASHSMWLYAFARDVGIARYMGERLMAAWNAVGDHADAESAWRAMRAANEAFSRDCKIHLSVLPVVMGCDAYVRAGVRSGHSEYFLRTVSVTPVAVRPGSLLHALWYNRRPMCPPVQPADLQASLRREVDAGHLPAPQYHQMLLQMAGTARAGACTEALERVVMACSREILP